MVILANYRDLASVTVFFLRVLAFFHQHGWRSASGVPSDEEGVLYQVVPTRELQSLSSSSSPSASVSIVLIIPVRKLSDDDLYDDYPCGCGWQPTDSILNTRPILRRVMPGEVLTCKVAVDRRQHEVAVHTDAPWVSGCMPYDLID